MSTSAVGEYVVNDQRSVRNIVALRFFYLPLFHY